MSVYIDGFLLPIAKDKIDIYQSIAAQCGAIWKEHGALAYTEAVLEDANSHDMRAFASAADAKEDETVVFAWIAYPSRSERDRINAAVMADPRINDVMKAHENPFDCKRMAYGGFNTIVNLS